VDSLCGTGEQTFVGTSLYMAVLILSHYEANVISRNAFKAIPTAYDPIYGLSGSH